ncbi:MAG: glutamine cyclotransferase [Flavobacteria bacterium RIFCSPLOWO2_12_FULL_35_11]|nr:MAG: glutamine cyclotransferase [Flavobacteria bacterium RIFCSPLOWO2_12_FULL_35_11]
MYYKSFFSFFIFLAIFSCKSEHKFIINAPEKIQTNQELTISVSEKNNKTIDSVQFLIDDKKVISGQTSATLKINQYKLGKHIVTALIFYANETTKVTATVYFLADSAPEIYTYKIINTYPHDKGAYTQGLEFLNGFLYEGTGKKGSSSIRKVELKSGKVLQQKDIDEQYFGEGITIFNNKLYQLTWQSGIGFVYDLNTFEQEKTFNYTKSREGWGLSHNGEKLIKTDGTEFIWFLNPETLAEEDYIEVYTNERKVEKLNELEFVNGLIYVNIWQQNTILMVNPATGKVEGVANLNSLKTIIEKEQKLEDSDEVLNGIAFDKDTNRLFVTGKHWSKLYEIELLKK